MEIRQIQSRRENYGGLRGCPVAYVVVHYTAGRNDTAEDNGRYFAREAVGASAHYFVDEKTVVQSVPDAYVAWHCGDAVYRHDHCRNSNSIGVELCCRWDGAAYSFAPETVERARQLIRQLMQKYEIPAERVLRHWDVTGKVCPAPFVGAGAENWEEFRGGLTMYQTMEQVPEWAKKTVQKLSERQILQGEGTGLALSRDMTRLLVILDRAGVFEKEDQTCPMD